MTKDLVSVVMAVHNEQPEFLREALESMFNQTYSPIELIIVDDASTDECKESLESICNGRSRVRIVHNEGNCGLTKSLNIGLGYVSGEFVARMDADDISHVERISKQVTYLRNYPDIDIVGTGVISFGAEEKYQSPSNGFSNDDAQCNLFFSSTLCHPSVMMRREFLERNHLRYDESVKKGQDYDLWERASVYGKLCVMNDVLLYYRMHKDQISSTSSSAQAGTSEMVRKRRLGRIGIVPSDEEWQCHELLNGGVNPDVHISQIENWIKKISDANTEKGFINSDALSRNLKERLMLYKLRNNKVFEHFSFSDIACISRIFVSRLRMNLKLRRYRRTE